MQFDEVTKIMYVTSFSSISHWGNSEYWTQERTQSGNIHSTISDVHAEKQSSQIWETKFPKQLVEERWREENNV